MAFSIRNSNVSTYLYVYPKVPNNNSEVVMNDLSTYCMVESRYITLNVIGDIDNTPARCSQFIVQRLPDVVVGTDVPNLGFTDLCSHEGEGVICRSDN